MANDQLKELLLLRDSVARTIKATQMTLILLVTTEGCARSLYYRGNREDDVDAINLMLDTLQRVISNLQLQQRFLVEVESKSAQLHAEEKDNGIMQEDF